MLALKSYTLYGVMRAGWIRKIAQSSPLMSYLSGSRNVKATVEQLGRPSLDGQKHELKLAARKLKIPHPTHPALSRSGPRSSQDTAIHVSRLPEVTHSAHILRRWLVRDIGWWCPNT
jgi:hypothetical protein